MFPSEKKLLKLLSNNDVTFYIPPYQRNYEWTNEQCKVFFDDIIKTAEANLGNRRVEHFFGTITYFESEQKFGEPSKLILIDGQQRITTTMLFLVALRDITTVDKDKDKDFITKKYLENDNISDDSEYKIKLKQVETDWDAYKKIIISSKDISVKDKESAVYRNYKFFYDELTLIKEKYNLQLLIDKGLSEFSVITIELYPERNSWENPQEIFESMNSLGKPLSLADLIRNYLLLGLSAEEQEKFYHNYWVAIERMLPGKLSDFIRDYMQCKADRPFPKAKEANYKELYASFKGLFDKKEKKDILEDLVEYASIYESIVGEKSLQNKEIDRLLKDINVLGATTTYSFIMEILKRWENRDFTDIEIIELLNVLYIYIWRRRLCGLSSGENKKIPLWNKKIEQIINSINKKDAFCEIISCEDTSMRMPNNTELRKILKTSDCYALKQLRFLFTLIEEKLSKSRPDLSDKNLQIEHIMPQTLNEEWKKMLGDDYINIHNEYLHSIGNLTLIRHNQELGNNSFDKKKDIYVNNSALIISQKEITNNEEWDGKAIEKRTNWIVDFILNEVLPVPENIFDLNAPKLRRMKHKSSFVSAGVIGKLINYIEDKSIVARVIDDKNVEFEGKIWKLSPLTREIKKRKGECNESGAYQGTRFWEYNGISVWDLCLK